MARIAGIDLPREKRIEIGLTYIYGIGRTSAQKILEMTGINPDIRVKDLTEDQEAALRDIINKYLPFENRTKKGEAIYLAIALITFFILLHQFTTIPFTEILGITN